jgi:hypothetical protein
VFDAATNQYYAIGIGNHVHADYVPRIGGVDITPGTLGVVAPVVGKDAARYADAIPRFTNEAGRDAFYTALPGGAAAGMECFLSAPTVGIPRYEMFNGTEWRAVAGTTGSMYQGITENGPISITAQVFHTLVGTPITVPCTGLYWCHTRLTFGPNEPTAAGNARVNLVRNGVSTAGHGLAISAGRAQTGYYEVGVWFLLTKGDTATTQCDFGINATLSKLTFILAGPI